MSDPTRFNRAVPEITERAAVQLIGLMFPRIREAGEKLEGEYVQVIDDRSSLSLDNRYLGRWRTGGLHVTAMAAAQDELRTVQTVLEPVLTGDSELPMSGLYPVLRSAIESASLAIYLLEPEERDERLRRAYRVAAEDGKYRSIFATSFGHPNPMEFRERPKREIRDLIATRPSLGAPEAFRFDSVAYSDLVELADAAMAADPALPEVERMKLLSWWQVLSGLSHGKQWAFMETMERSDAIVDEADRSAQVKMTSSASTVALPLQLAVESLETALRLYGRRSKATWAQPEDAEEPATVPYTLLRGPDE